MDTTVESTLKAAVQALENHDSEGAIASLEALIHREPPIEQLPEMFARGLLAPALASLGRINDARAHAQRAQELANELGDSESATHYDALVRQLDVVGLDDKAIEQAFDRAAAYLDNGDAVNAEAELHNLLLAALAHRRADIEASARGMMAQAMLLRGANAEAKDQVQRALELADEMGDEDAREHFAGLVAQLATDDGAERFRREAEIIRRSEEAEKFAGKAMEAGDFDLAVSVLLPVSADAEFAGVKHKEATLRGMLAQAHLLANRRKEAEREAKAAIAIAESLGAKEAAEGFRQILQLAIGFVAPVQDA